MQISLIVAAAENGVIAVKGGRIPWHLPADQAYFRAITKGHPIIMGRTTYEEIGHALPDRRNIIITHQPDYEAPDCTVVHSIEDALRTAEGAQEVFIIGGGSLYEQTLLLADKIYLTRVHAEPDGTVFFRYDPEAWQEVSTEHHPADEQNQYAYTFSIFTRASKQ